MIRLLSLHVGEARHLRSVDLEFAAQGPTVVHGPNEAGKSTLVACLGVLFAVSSTSRREDVRSLAGPSGAVEIRSRLRLEHGGRRHEVELAKRWLQRPMTQLVVDGRTLEGREAEQRFEALLGEAGVGTPDEEPMVRWLFERQGALEPKGASLDASRALARALERTSGSEELVAPVLLKRVRDELERYQTPKRRDPTGELGAAKQQLERLAREVAEARNAVLEAEHLAEEVRELEEELESIPATIDALEEERARVAATVEELTQAVTAEPALTERRAGLARDLEERRRARERWTELTQAIATKERELDEVRAASERTARARGELLERRRALEEDLGALRARLVELRAEREAASRDERYQQAATEREGLQARLERVEALRAERAALEASAPRSLPAHLVERLQILDGELVRVRANLEESAPRLLVESPTAASIEVDGEPRPLGPDHPYEAAVVDLVRLRIGEVTITLQPGTVRGDLARVATERASVLAELGVADVAEALRLQEAVARHADQVRSLSERIEELASEAEERRLRDRLGELASRLAEGPPPPPAHPLETIDDELSRLEAREHTIDERLLELLDRVEGLEAERDRLERSRSTLEAALAADRARLQGLPEPEVLDPLVEGLEAELSTLDAQLEAIGEHRRVLEQRRSDLDAVARELRSREQRRVEVETRLEERRARLAESPGRSDRLARAEEELADAEANLARLEAARRAAEILLDALEEANRTVRERTQAPYRGLLERLLARVLGERVEVELDEHLDVLGIRRPDRGQELLEPSQLSAGTQEQLALCVRVAATRLSGAVPVVLDDVLGFSDAQRGRRLVAELETLAEDGQAIVFTAHPERYGAASNLARIELGAVPPSMQVAGGMSHSLITPEPHVNTADHAATSRSKRPARADDQQRISVLELLRGVDGPLSRSQVAEALGLGPELASQLLRELRDEGLVTQEGERRGARYHLTPGSSLY